MTMPDPSRSPRRPRGAAATAARVWWPGWVVAMLLVGLALSGRDSRQWMEYCRLVLLAGALGGTVLVKQGVAQASGLTWARRLSAGSAEAVFLAAVLMATAAQLSLPHRNAWSAMLWVGLVALVWVAPAVTGKSGCRSGIGPRWMWTTGLLGGLVLMLSLAVPALPGMQSLWPSSLQWLLYPLLWVGLARWLSLAVPAQRRRVSVPALVVVLTVAGLGGWQAAQALWTLRLGDRAVREDAPARATYRYRQAWDTATKIGMDRVADAARMGLATQLAAQGALDEAGAVMGHKPGSGVTIAPDQWEGPTGGHLFHHGPCWYDIGLWAGVVEVDIRAGGRAARGHWPELVVELGDRELGVMRVDAPAGVTQTFSVPVETGTHRLRLRLQEGYWSSQGEHRTVRLDTVQVRYRDAE